MLLSATYTDHVLNGVSNLVFMHVICRRDRQMRLKCLILDNAFIQIACHVQRTCGLPRGNNDISFLTSAKITACP